ncbi:tRNA uridine-5-carboxymethylaminomethyl(34) synthesis GTPase MnmE [Candidatus Riflebacteria bacterium]
MVVNLKETIVAISTPDGCSAVGIVRLTGPGVINIIEKLTGQSKFRPRYFRHCLIKKGDEIIDDTLVVCFNKPDSYTGEDLVEIHCHGNPDILKEVLGECLSLGARLAEPGEFTLRAFLNNKMDLVQAEAVGSLIHARGGLNRKAALANLSQNFFGQEIFFIREKIFPLLTQVEALIDFPEEDIPPLDREEAEAIIKSAVQKISALLGSERQSRFISHGIKICLIGEVNAGKSTLLNQILGENRAIVTDIPGTTRDFLEEVIEFKGVCFRIFDTAGFRETAEAVEKIGMQKTVELMESADLILQIIDYSENQELTGIEDFTYLNTDIFQLLNKIDLLDSKIETSKTFQLPVFFISAKTGHGVGEVLRAIYNKFMQGELAMNKDYLLNTRQISCLKRAMVCLNGALQTLLDGYPEDLLASDLFSVIEELGMITGQTCPEDILDEIFKTYCVGK